MIAFQPTGRATGERVLRFALAGVSAAAVVLYLWVALRRVGYPYELEWMEGGVVDHVRRALDGDALYGPPSVEFTPYVYSPLYYYAAAPVAWVVGLGYVPLRAVSIVASLCAFTAVGALVVHETRDRLAGLAAGALFAASYGVGGAWLDLARVDSLFLALMFGGLVLARRGRFVVASVVLSLAVLTKQQALLPALAILPWALRGGRRDAVAYGSVLAVGVLGPTLLLDVLSDGWYRIYAFELPAAHPLVPRVWTSFWTVDLLAVVGTAAVLGVVALQRSRAGWFHGPIAAALVLTAYASRLHLGGWDNVLLPAYGGVAVLFGLAVAELPWRRTVLALGCVQLALLLALDRPQVPDAADRAAGGQLLADLRALPGTVWVPGHGWYAARAGGAVTAQGAAMSDVLKVDGPWRNLLVADLDAAVRSQRFDAVVVDEPARYSYLPEDFDRWYRPAGTVEAPLPPTGTPAVPATVWVPIRDR